MLGRLPAHLAVKVHFARGEGSRRYRFLKIITRLSLEDDFSPFLVLINMVFRKIKKNHRSLHLPFRS